MVFRWDDIRFLLDQLDAEARGRRIDRDRIRDEAERLMDQYPGMSGLLSPIAQRYVRQVA
jgi:hypothetical protein